MGKLSPCSLPHSNLTEKSRASDPAQLPPGELKTTQSNSGAEVALLNVGRFAGSRQRFHHDMSLGCDISRECDYLQSRELSARWNPLHTRSDVSGKARYERRRAEIMRLVGSGRC